MGKERKLNERERKGRETKQHRMRNNRKWNGKINDRKGHRKGKKRKGIEQLFSGKKTYFDSQRLSTLPAGAFNLELELQNIYLF